MPWDARHGARNDLPAQFNGVRGLVGQLAGEQFVQDDAQAVDVAAVIECFAFNLFRTHVRHVPKLPPSPLSSGEKAIPKSVEQRPAVVVEQDVRRLDVPVNEPLPVGIGQRLGDLGDQAGGFLCGRAVLGDAVGQAAALDELGRR